MTAVERVRQWRLKNPGRRNATERKRYGAKSADVIAYQSQWVCRNRGKRRGYEKKYRDQKRVTDPNFRLKDALRRRIRHALDGGKKSAKTLELLGCSPDELRVHLETQFVPGMSWDNYGKGRGKWNIDHIKPCASFDLTDPVQQRLCFRFTNMQPLWEEDNVRKGASLCE